MQKVDKKNMQSYSLTALQEGMLFHSISRPASGVDIEQIVFNLNESLNFDLFIQAWEQVAKRYPVLRTRFVWESQQDVLQQAMSEVSISSTILDWSNLEIDEQERRFAGLQKSDRLQDFDMAVAPLFRLAIIKLEAKRFRGLWTFHHAILDGRSFPIILTELFDTYESFISGKTLHLPPITPFSDYVEWQQGLDFDQSKTYWQKKLEGYAAPLEIGFKSHDQDDQNFEVDAIEQLIDEATAGRLAELAKSQGVTQHTLLQAAWALMLHHYSGEEDIVFGSTRANRHATIPGAEDIVGLLINTVPVRIHIEDGKSLAEFLIELRHQHVELRKYEQTPLTTISGWSDITAGKPLFNSLVVFENYLLDTRMKSLGGNWRNREFSYLGQTNFPMTLIGYADASLILRLEFRSSLFSRDFADALLKHTCNLLENFVGRLETPIKAIPYLSELEQQRLLDNSIAQNGGNITHQSVNEKFASVVSRHPNAVAVKFEKIEMTYQQLERSSNKLALELAKLGVNAGDLVGLCVDRSIHTVIGILGILKSGAAYVPIDPKYPTEHLEYIIDDARISAVITSMQYRSKVSHGAIRNILIDQIDFKAEMESSDNDSGPDCALTADHIAYVIYTSGSTGRPKGVLVTHRNILRLFDSTNELFHFDSSDVWTLFHSYAFDFSVWEIWGALLYGGKLVVVPFWISRSPEDFYLLLVQEGVTVLNQTPSAFRQLSNFEDINGVSSSLKLRYIIFGGEALDFVSLRSWFEKHGDERPILINMYGITETTVHVTYRRVLASDTDGSTGSLIGKPISDLSMYLLNHAMYPVPPGAPGEIYVGGGGVTKGYLNREELTKERFIKNPFVAEGGTARLYKTGDVGRYQFDGELEYIGRSDLQVKVRGFRIELGEIESKLSAHSEILENTVIVRALTGDDLRIVAYYVCAEGSNLAVEALKLFLEQRLPEHMVPSVFMQLDGLPLTNNGKIDRGRLPKPVSNIKSNEALIAPENEMEQKLLLIWEHILDVQDISVTDNFFNLGGDSIISIKLIVYARKQGINFTPKDIFHSPTIRELAMRASLSHQQKPRAGSMEPIDGSADLLPIQHWFFEQNLNGRDYWNQVFLFDCKEKIDIERLKMALARLIVQHDSLRLRFTPREDRYLQSYSNDNLDAAVDIFPLGNFVGQDISAEITRISIELQNKLNIEIGPVMRLAIIKSDVSESDRLLIAIHHLVVDGVSWQILMEDLEQCYFAIKAQQESFLPHKTSSYQTWARRLGEFANTAAAEKELGYWKSLFSKPYVNNLPVDKPGYIDNTESSVGIVSVCLTEVETEQLLTRANNAYHTRINDILIFALLSALNEWCETDCVHFDMEGHGREDLFDDVDLSRTVGWFTSIFPCLIRLDRQADIGTGLIAVKEYIRAIPNSGLGFSALKYLNRKADIQSAIDSMPSAQVLFNYLGQLDQIVKGSGIFAHSNYSTGPWHHPDANRKYLLEINSFIKNNRLVSEWSFSENIHNRAQIIKLAHAFIDQLNVVVRHCTEKMDRTYTRSDFPLAQMDQNQLLQLQHKYSDISDIYPLSPMQHLYYSLTESSEDIGVDQWFYTLKGDLNIEQFRHAWKQVINNHSALSSCFIAAPLNKPHQIVLKNVDLSWVYLDWQGKSLPWQEAHFHDYLESDKAVGLTIEKGPLTRITLIHFGESEYRVVWTHHHLQIDGWSWPLVLQDVSRHYTSLNSGGPLDSNSSDYKKYIAWLYKPRKSDERSFWKNILQGIPLDTKIPISKSTVALGVGQRFEECQLTLDTQSSRQLDYRARSIGVTLNTLFQGAWGILLAAVNNCSEVIFGASFSGRPVGISGVESIVGPFVNTLPVRVSVTADQNIVEWLKSLNIYLLDISEYQHSSLPDIYDYAEIPANKRLFESLLVFQNYQKGDASERMGPIIKICDFNAPIRTQYPITIVVIPGEQINIKLIYKAPLITHDEASNILNCIEELLEYIATQDEADLERPISIAAAHDFYAGRTEVVSASTSYVAPKPGIEVSIAKVWRQAFQLDKIGIKDDFFSLGGQSILMVKLHLLLEEELGTRVSIARLFQYPTIEKLANYLEGGDTGFTSIQQTQDRATKQRMARAKQKNKRKRGK